MAFITGLDDEYEANPNLIQPNIWLPFLANGLDGEYFFFTHDLNRIVVYLSESIWSVCKVHPEDWIGKPLCDFLTPHWMNQCLSLPGQELEPGKIYRVQVEVWDSERKPVPLDVWRSLVLEQDTPIGMVGMARRHHEPFPKSVLEEVNLRDVRRRMAMLNHREMEVVRLVVQGELNKSIAKMLGGSMRTVEARRSKAMEKLGTNRLSELIRCWILTMEPPTKESESG